VQPEARGAGRRDPARPEGGRLKRPWARGAGLAAGAAGLALAPAVLPPYELIGLCHALVLAVACLGLNLLFGTTGLLSLGHAAFFGTGAYAGGFLYMFGPVTAFEVYLLSGMLAATLLAAVLGFLCVRARRIHFTILTLAFAQMLHALFVSGAAFRPFGEVGKGLYLLGEGGLYIPRFTLLGAEVPAERFIPVFYYVILAAFLASAGCLWRITRSPFGAALRAIRENATRAALVGIPVARYRWGAFVLSGLFTGLAGGLYGQLARQITPEQLHWLFSAQLVLATVLGGSRHFWGPVAGAGAFVVLEEVSLRAVAGRGLILGGLLIAVVFLAPDGLAGLAARLRRRPSV
jgi:branched-chain amino acid transport system permease protein